MSKEIMSQVSIKQRRATRLAFLAVGLAVSAWAPLVPYVKERLGLGEAALGLLLLCMGCGSLILMPFTGNLTARFGSRAVILCSGTLACLTLPCLAVAASPQLLGVTLFLFGAATGMLGMASNITAVTLEQKDGAVLMSGFHCLFSFGGFAGAASMTLLLKNGLSPLAASAAIALLVLLVLYMAGPHLLRDTRAPEPAAPPFMMPHGAVMFIGILCFCVFLAEGAMLDWGAVFLTGRHELDPGQSGLGYAAFSIAMTIGRLNGDRMVRRFGGERVLMLGGLCAAGGFFAAVLAPSAAGAVCGFMLIGIGASNIVPILYSAAGRQSAMPATLAVGTITTIGFMGLLAGPAMIGFVAHATSLNLAFAALGCMMLLVAASARVGAASPKVASAI